ncbi:uncharacterized protein LOC127059363 [Serinus canaria]|uniref:uncharacterized protein LOC127059363 n=1 Tax=Serinus canaria TaxID=9135 RepID=UPI0021CC93D9|nr:uncharacterized protein LOC127059363 [Serinus canaria]
MFLLLTKCSKFKALLWEAGRRWEMGSPALNRLPREWSQPQGCQSSRNMWTMLSGTGGDCWGCAGQGVWTWIILVGRFQLRIFHSTLHFFQLLWICLLLPRFLQLSGYPDPSLSLKRCPFIPKSSLFASQGISLGGGGLKMRILDSGCQLIPLCCRSGMPGHLGKVEQVEMVWKKQDHSSLTPVLWENQPWEQRGSSAGVIWEPKRMDKDPAASIPSPTLLLAPLPTAKPEWMEQNPQAGTCSPWEPASSSCFTPWAGLPWDWDWASLGHYCIDLGCNTPRLSMGASPSFGPSKTGITVKMPPSNFLPSPNLLLPLFFLQQQLLP